MTSELRPAVEVWRDAYEASYYDEVDDDRAAAAVIEADREAVRAEQAAEVERLKKLIEATSAHFLRLNTDHPIMWEGAIDAAMEAVCLEVERQAAELAKFKALAETLAGALGKSRDGWANALEFRLIPERHRNTAEILAQEAAEALRQYKEARDAS